MNIFNLPIIQIALSLIISWALFAIFVGLIQEAFAQVMAERGRFMKKYLLKQLRDESNGVNWASLLYLHGSIDLLTREVNKPTNDINPSLFARVLIEVIGSSQIVQMKKRNNNYENTTLSNFKSALQTLKNSDVISFLKLAMNNAELKKPSSEKDPNEGIVYDHLILEISNWYKEFVERLTLWYKKRMRKKLFVIGLLVGIIVNVDSIQLFNFYKVNPQSATSVQNYYKDYIAKPDLGDSLTNDIRLQSVKSLDSLVKVANLPVGFDYSIFKSRQSSGNWLFWKILGLLITGFAVSFGAPFWFDVLKKAYSKNIQI